MRAIWSGAIGFGLVNIPVKLFSAIQANPLDFDMLDKKGHANIKFQRVNEVTGKEVTWGNIVKGYKVDDKYVIVTDEDFEKASPEKTKLIEINQFINESEIESIYYETAYYLQPEKAGIRAYALLRDALEKTGKAGLGSFVLRNRESLVVVKPRGAVLLLQKIRFEEEVRAADELKIPVAKSKPNEVKMAVELIGRLSKKFTISKFKDEYTAKLLKLIKAKARGKPLKTSPLKVVHSRNRDLMEQLKASLTSSKRKAS